MVDKGSEPKNDLDECDYERLAELNEYIDRLEEEVRQLTERAEKAERRCMLADAIFIALFFAFAILAILQVAH